MIDRSMNEGPRIIALTGPKTCGKDTLAKSLLQLNTEIAHKYVPLFKKTPFAQGIKKICHDIFGWSYSAMDDPIFKETPLLGWPLGEPRWPMMDIGNWFRDKYGPDVWVRALDKVIHESNLNDPHGAYIITDLRFPNELDWLDNQNSLVVYIERDEAEAALSKARQAGDLKALNPSESHYDEMRERADFILPNNGYIWNASSELMNIVQRRFNHWTYWNMGPHSRGTGQ